MNIDLNNTDSVIDWLCDDQSPVIASISIAKLAALISKALELDGLEHNPNAVLSLLVEPIGNQDELMSQANAAIDAGTVFLHGSDWIVSLAEHFGFQGERDGFVDMDWLDDRPCMRSAYRALTMLAVKAMGAALDVYEQQHGHSMMEVFMASCETGEDFDQSKARLTAQRQGLRVVK